MISVDQRTQHTRFLTKLALLTAILVVLSVTPVGSIPLPFVCWVQAAAPFWVEYLA